MSILKGIKLKGDATTHQLDYEQGVANKPKIVTSWNDLEDKPFHDDGEAREVIVEEVALELEENTSRVGMYEISYPNENPLGLKFVEGETLIYIWNGVEYECTTTKIVDSDGIFVYKIGNESFNTDNGVDTGEPFFISLLGTLQTPIVQVRIDSNVQNATLEVQRAYKTVQTIDGKYVKDMYYSEESVVDIMPLQDVDFVYAEDGYAYEGTLAYTDIKIGDTINVNWNGTEYSCETINFAPLVGGDNSIVIPALGRFSEDDAPLPFIIVFDVTGALTEGLPVMMIMDIETEPNEEVQVLTKQIGITYGTSIIKQIQPKYIKDMYYVEEGQDKEIFPSQEITLTDGTYEQEGILDLTVGETYKVVIDGVEHTYEAHGIDSMGQEVIYIGNGANFGAENTDELFTIATLNSMNTFAIVFYDEATTHTVAIYQGGEIVHQIPSKYVNAYTKEEIDAMFGAYVDDVDTLLGGNE